jgi:hypothetical protein
MDAFLEVLLSETSVHVPYHRQLSRIAGYYTDALFGIFRESKQSMYGRRLIYHS